MKGKMIKAEYVSHAIEVLELTHSDFREHRNSISSDSREHYDACLRNLDSQIHLLRLLVAGEEFELDDSHD